MAIIVIWVFRNFGLIFNTFLWQMYAERGNQRVVWKKRFKKHFDVISRCWYKTISTGNLVAWLQSILLFVFANSLIAPNTMFHLPFAWTWASEVLAVFHVSTAQDVYHPALWQAIWMSPLPPTLPYLSLHSSATQQIKLSMSCFTSNK